MADIFKFDRYFLNLCNISAETMADPILVVSAHSNALLPDNYAVNSDSAPKRKCRPNEDTNVPDPILAMPQRPPADMMALFLNGSDLTCDAQDESLDLMIVIVTIVRNVMMLPVGIFLDIYGTTRTRLLAV